MHLIPEHRALLGVDVAESAGKPGHQLAAVPEALEDLLTWALRGSGIDRAEVLDWEKTGDGALLTLPSGQLGALLDTADLLDVAAARRNRRYQPDIRLRIAIESGPVGQEPGFYPAKIGLNRMLDAQELKDLFVRCRQEREEDAHTALIVSEHAFRTAFGGDHTSLIRRSEFGSLEVRNKEYVDSARVRVRGFDPRSLEAFSQPTQDPSAAPTGGVRNINRGDIRGIQAGQIIGNVSQDLR